MACLLRADDPVKQKVQVSSTQHLDLATGGMVKLMHSSGELTIEGWDQPGVEITTVKSTRAEYTAAQRAEAAHALDGVQITAGPDSGGVAIATHYRRRRPLFLAFLAGGDGDIDVSYRIKVPRDARLTVDHEIGDIFVNDVTGDIHATTHQGTITLRLPPGSQYELDAKSAIGSVTSDFPGTTTRRWWLVGHQFLEASQAPHKLYLRTGFGDILFLRAREPQAPAPLHP